MGLTVTARAQSNDCVDTRLSIEPGDKLTIWGLFDAHIDNIKCDIDLLKSEIQEMADDPYSRVIIGGDFNDLMFAPGDYRYLPSGLAAKLNGKDDIIEDILEWNIELLWPIRHKIDMVIYGNHESSYEKRHRVNITKATVNALNARMRAEDENSPVIPFAGYGSYKRYYLSCERLSKSVVSTGWVHHGSGGDAPVTKGVISLTRTMTDFDFDWHMSGHIHKATANNAPKLGVAGDFGYGKLISSDRVAVVCGTYERNYPMGQKSTFSMEKRHAPAPLGAGKIFLRPKLNKAGTLICKAGFH